MVHLRSARLIYEIQTFIQANGIAHCDITMIASNDEHEQQTNHLHLIFSYFASWIKSIKSIEFHVLIDGSRVANTLTQIIHFFPKSLINTSPQGELLTCL